ncbi:hypothetical protein ACRAWD_00995 [Caulobacter segnis]
MRSRFCNFTARLPLRRPDRQRAPSPAVRVLQRPREPAGPGDILQYLIRLQPGAGRLRNSDRRASRFDDENDGDDCRPDRQNCDVPRTITLIGARHVLGAFNLLRVLKRPSLHALRCRRAMTIGRSRHGPADFFLESLASKLSTVLLLPFTVATCLWRPSSAWAWPPACGRWAARSSGLRWRKARRRTRALVNTSATSASQGVAGRHDRLPAGSIAQLPHKRRRAPRRRHGAGPGRDPAPATPSTQRRVESGSIWTRARRSGGLQRQSEAAWRAAAMTTPNRSTSFADAGLPGLLGHSHWRNSLIYGEAPELTSRSARPVARSGARVMGRGHDYDKDMPISGKPGRWRRKAIALEELLPRNVLLRDFEGALQARWFCPAGHRCRPT